MLQIKCPLQVDIPKAKGSLLGPNSEQTVMVVPDLPLHLLNVILLNCWRRADGLDSVMFSYETIPSCREVNVATRDPKHFPSSRQRREGKFGLEDKEDVEVTAQPGHNRGLAS